MPEAMIGHPPPNTNPYQGWRFVGWTKPGPFGRMVIAPVRVETKRRRKAKRK